MNEIIRVPTADLFVKWALQAGALVRMVRTGTAFLEMEAGVWVQRPAVRIDYAFDVVIAPNLVRTWTYSEIRRVGHDGTILFDQTSPYSILAQQGREPLVTHPRSGSL